MADTFSFLKLPAEIRLQIYRNLFVGHGMCCVYDLFPVFPPLHSKSLHPAILRCCRMINQEATPVLYGENHLRVSRHFFKQDNRTEVTRSARNLTISSTAPFHRNLLLFFEFLVEGGTLEILTLDFRRLRSLTIVLSDDTSITSSAFATYMAFTSSTTQGQRMPRVKVQGLVPGEDNTPLLKRKVTRLPKEHERRLKFLLKTRPMNMFGGQLKTMILQVGKLDDIDFGFLRSISDGEAAFGLVRAPKDSGPSVWGKYTREFELDWMRDEEMERALREMSDQDPVGSDDFDICGRYVVQKG